MAELKWIKLNLDMFDNRKIKQIRKLPGGNDMVLFWVMLLTLAGRSNCQGYILFTENIPYTPEMLSTECDIELNTVKMALEIFSKFGMITIKEETIAIMGWSEHQNVEGMERAKVLTNERVKRHRAKKKELLKAAEENNNSESCNVDVTLHETECNTKLTHLEEDKEEEIEIEEDNYLLYIENIIEYYCSKAGILSVNFKPKEVDVAKELLNKKIPVDVIKKGIDEAFKNYKPSFQGEKISSFNYCKPVVLKLWNNINAKKKKEVKKDESTKRSDEGSNLRDQGIGL
ncbi:phage replisome organizer N-terminal domain-containing protein [Clostridium sp. OS1-26]|uniref:phage replisome organizer N-terminal domain-containing protein n=1 Tax=Clostridium sp. OS1-26 TaxID=3070681 RepID=UPI0027DFEB40|nr:phage replisome organizer N-terminal domain-containing protein [Clostridium sp. OS1-26]WML35375.1 phage replisome organizer N-terminal domain-containing protein [Clostridium sp. OS1-26]